MFSNRPLYATAADARLYVDTAAARRFRDAVSRGQNTLLIGDAGAGKTTVLHMTELRLRQRGIPYCFVGLAQARNVGDAAVALARAAADSDWIAHLDEGLVREALADRDPFAPNSLLRLLDRAPTSATFILDDVGAEIGHALFGRLRDELWQLKLTWGVAADAAQASGLLVPPADAFFDRRITLAPLGAEDRVRLLEERSASGSEPLSSRQIKQLADRGPGNPRQLVSYARHIAQEGLRPGDVLQGADRRRQRAEAVGGRAAAMLVAEMEGLGPVSASDERLLERLGWTRPRAAGLLTALEEQGVVVSYQEHRERPGRPRKLYELRAPAEFLEAEWE